MTRRRSTNSTIFKTLAHGLLLSCVILLSAAGVFAQDPGKIAFANLVDGNWDLFQIDTDGTRKTRLSFNTTSEQSGFDFSRNGRRVVFVFFSNIYIMNSNGTDVRQLTTTNNNSFPGISPDGTMVTFTSNRGNNTDIYVVNADGTNLRRVTTNQFVDQRSSFSPDGTKLLFDTNRNSQFGLPNLYVINVDGMNETRLTTFFEFGGRFSPNGNRIVYQGRTMAGQDGFNEIFVMDADGGNQAQLTSNLVQDENPAFSLDGSLIAFEENVDVGGGLHRDQIFVMDANGNNAHQVTAYDPINQLAEIPKWVPTNLLATRASAFDIDGEGRSDLAVFRPTEGNWYRQNYSDVTFSAVNWGLGTDKLVPADYDGDARTDQAIFRDGTWWILRSSDGQAAAVQFGTTGDIPTPGDYDADGKADISVFRPSTGTWYRQDSSTSQFIAIQFGQNGDKPMLGDRDGDGKADITIFRPSTGAWYIHRSSDNQVQGDAFGQNGDMPVTGDFNGDGRADLAVFRPSTATWYVARTTGVPSQSFDATQFGISTDVPVGADYDGDRKTDIAVYRAGQWWILRSSDGQAVTAPFGIATDLPIASAYQQ